ncbi:MAG TPA: LysM peptidoglycan-binding domain-containing protein [Gaiellaceae bacterium]|nr:LysM peptidoglycan-binding domain-containing protein [Gaiellaceae bacterium]
MFAKFLIVLLLAALAVGLVAHSSQGAGPERSYVVKPADTLWSIAARTYGGDTREGVWKLQQRNHLATATLVPGQRLVLPAG